jgi:hypothetical protein
MSDPKIKVGRRNGSVRQGVSPIMRRDVRCLTAALAVGVCQIMRRGPSAWNYAQLKQE